MISSGILREMTKKVYDAVFQLGRCTGSEVHEYLKIMGHNYQISSVRARVKELFDNNLLVEIDKRECSVTGKKCITRAVSKNVITSLNKSGKKKVTQERYDEAIAIIKEFANYGGDLREWRDEMYATLLEVIRE